MFCLHLQLKLFEECVPTIKTIHSYHECVKVPIPVRVWANQKPEIDDQALELQHIAKITLSLFLIFSAGFKPVLYLKRLSDTGVSSQFYKILKNICFTKHLRATASDQENNVPGVFFHRVLSLT